MTKKIQLHWFIYLLPFLLVMMLLSLLPANAAVVNGSISIAAGSSSAVGSFQADQYYSGGSAYRNNNTIDVSQITSNPPPAALFNNERYGAMSYTIPGFNTGSSYWVTLYFVETYLTAAGRRLFNVSINGATVLSNFDIYGSAGGQNKAIARTFTAMANSSGQIVIQFTSGTENPKVNGISIKPGGSNPTPTQGYNTPTPTRRVITPTTTRGLSPTARFTPTPTRGINGTPTPTSPATGTTWVGTWGTAPQLTESSNMPPSPGLSYNTLRQVVHVSIGGEQVRIKFSNQYGNSSVVMNSVHLAVSSGGSSINTSTDKALTFGGNPSVTMSPGQTVTSDTLNFTLTKQTNVAITIYFGSVSSALTGHPGSRTTSYIQTGNNVSASSMSSAAATDHWFIITGIDVLTDRASKAVVALGDSITDGRGSTTNGNDRWTDNLANRLLANSATSKVGVLNAGIGGNNVLTGGLGPTALSRFDRDATGQSGVRYLIILEGVNDIGGSSSSAVANDLISAYQQFISKAHASGILVYGATILPFGGSQYSSTVHEQARQTVNNWIKTSGQFDGVIDFDAALRNPSNPANLSNTYDSGDHLHPNAAGYRKMADSIDLNLFTK